MTTDGNEIFDNFGPGIWYDVDSDHATISNNRVHHNLKSGIFYEISTDAQIFGNRIWENGWRAGWRGPGIWVMNARNVEVWNNMIAWNPDGIHVFASDRSNDDYFPDPAHNDIFGVYVHDNVIVKDGQQHPADATGGRALDWEQDDGFDGGMFDPISQNRGARNRYWYREREAVSTPRFGWGPRGPAHTFWRLAAFNATPGEEGGTYLSNRELERVLEDAGIPARPEKQ